MCQRGHCSCQCWLPSLLECSWAGRPTGCGGATWTGGKRGCRTNWRRRRRSWTWPEIPALSIPAGPHAATSRPPLSRAGGSGGRSQARLKLSARRARLFPESLVEDGYRALDRNSFSLHFMNLFYF